MITLSVTAFSIAMGAAIGVFAVGWISDMRYQELSERIKKLEGEKK